MYRSSSRPFRAFRRLFATGGFLAIAALGACNPPPPPPPPPPPEPVAPHQATANLPSFFTMPNMAAERTPVRVGVILPFSDASANNRLLATAMMNAMTLALYDSGNGDIVLMAADDAGPGNSPAKAAQSLLDQGAEVIVGPIFSASAAAVAPAARDHGVPVLAFSTDRAVAGNGVYLVSFQLQNEIDRIVAYAVAHGHRKLAAMIPLTPYGNASEQAFRSAAAECGAQVVAVQRYNPAVGAVNDPAAAIAKSGADAIFMPQSGSLLRALVPALAYNGLDLTKVKLLGTGLWFDPANTKEPLLAGSWFAAPQPSADDRFREKYAHLFGAEPPQLAALAYDAVSLAALLAKGTPYHRFTASAISDPNGFFGAGGIFRFRADGSIERGLSVLEVGPDGFTVVSPAPTTFQKQKAGS